MRDSNDDLLDQIHAVRYALHEEIKDMTPSEMTAYLKAKVAPFEKEFGLKVVDKPLPRKYESKAAL